MEQKFKLEKSAKSNLKYDKAADALYISFGKPRPALTKDLGSGIFARYDEESGKMVGLTVTGLSSILGKA